MEWPFLAIPNLYQSFGKNCQKKIETAIFGHSKFIPVFLGNIVRKRLEQTFLAIPNLYQSFWEKLLEKIWNNHFWPFQIYTSLFGKNCWKKFRMAIFGHSKFVPVFLRKIVGKRLENGHFWPFQIYTSPFGKNCQKKLEHPFLAIPNLYQSFWEKLLEKKFGMAIFGHSKFIPVLLGNIVKKKIGTSIFGHS